MDNITCISNRNFNQIRMIHIVTAALSGIVAAGIFNLLYIFWAEEARLPSHAWLPYFIYTLIAGAVAGIITIYHKHGIVIGAFIYAILPFLLGAIFNENIFFRPSLSRLIRRHYPEILLCAGYCISYAALVITRFVSKRRYQQVDIPPDSYDNPLLNVKGRAAGVFAVAMIISIIYGWLYFSRIRYIHNLPQATVASFCWMISSKTNYDLDSYKFLFAKQSFEAIQANPQFFNGIKTSIKLPSRYRLHGDILRGDYYNFFAKDEEQYSQTAIITVKARDEFEGTGNMQLSTLKLPNLYETSFYLIKENGEWQIYSISATERMFK
ncbi:MAG: hypothetical protein ACYC27_06815 [Armatimonadota bacterium]